MNKFILALFIVLPILGYTQDSCIININNTSFNILFNNKSHEINLKQGYVQVSSFLRSINLDRGAGQLAINIDGCPELNKVEKDKKIGWWIELTKEETAIVLSTVFYKKGRPHGVETLISSNSSTTITTYRRGEFHGIKKCFLGSQLIYKFEFKHGKLIRSQSFSPTF